MSDETKTPAPQPEMETPMRRLVLTRPFNCTAMNFPREDGGTIVVTSTGTDVPAKDADALIQTAAQHGVTLTEVSE